jgi:hypothetical protein
MKKIILKRAKMEQWIEHERFGDLVRDAFVRVSFSNQYRLAEIVGIREDTDKEYELGKVRTNIVLLLSAGGISARPFKIALVSNQDATEQEFR